MINVSLFIMGFELFWLYCYLAVLFCVPQKKNFFHVFIWYLPVVSHLGMVVCFNIKSMCLPEEILEPLWVCRSLSECNLLLFLFCFVFCLLFCFVSPLFQTDTNKSITQKPLTQVFSLVAIFLLLGHVGYANDKANQLNACVGKALLTLLS